MTRSSELRARIDNVRDLRAVVGAMRALAAARLRRGEDALAGIRAYAGAVRGALADALAMVPGDRVPDVPVASHPRRIALAFGAEHGFVGAFHGPILDAADGAARAGAEMWIAGRRAVAAARERAVPVARALESATNWDALEQTVRDYADAIGDLLAQRAPVRVDLLYATRDGVTARAVVPLDPSGLGRGHAAAPPMSYLDPLELFDRLTGEYLLAQIALAATESFAAENRARLRAMDDAHRSMERKLDELSQAERGARQSEITTEVLEVVAGAAVVGEDRR